MEIPKSASFGGMPLRKTAKILIINIAFQIIRTLDKKIQLLQAAY
jgi:hypothetical protein